jgi:hypothetical protein
MPVKLEKCDSIDRLVLGDMDDGERASLIAWLEEEPLRWRQCGLAFLEAQLWEDAFRQAADCRTFRSIAGPRPVVERAGTTGTGIRIQTLLLSLAATVTVAFTLGVFAGSATNQHVAQSAAAGSAGHAPAVAGDRTATRRTATAPDRVNSVEAADSATLSNVSTSQATQTFTVVRLSMANSDSREIQVPLLEGQAIDERWLQAEPAEIPEAVQGELERRGYQLRQRRRFLDVRLEDGRRAIVPVDQYQVSFAGHPLL